MIGIFFGGKTALEREKFRTQNVNKESFVSQKEKNDSRVQMKPD
jgi:hypothetical protein